MRPASQKKKTPKKSETTPTRVHDHRDPSDDARDTLKFRQLSYVGKMEWTWLKRDTVKVGQITMLLSHRPQATTWHAYLSGDQNQKYTFVLISSHCFHRRISFVCSVMEGQAQIKRFRLSVGQVKTIMMSKMSRAAEGILFQARRLESKRWWNEAQNNGSCT